MAAEAPHSRADKVFGEDSRFHAPYGSFQLRRFPARKREPLLAWCGADSLLLEAAHERDVEAGESLVVNDAHGALSVALQPYAVWTDSALSVVALTKNCERNGLPVPTIIASTSEPPARTSVIVLRIPRQLPYFLYQLSTLANTMPPGTLLLAAGMDKHLSAHTAEHIERHFGPTERLPGRRKARVFVSALEGRPVPSGQVVSSSYFCDALGAHLEALPNVFSREALDQGSRLLIENLARLDSAERAIDLACGNGVIGLCALRLGLVNELTFVDESAMAVASAQCNATRLFPQGVDNLHFLQADGIASYAGAAADLVLCNPPFHIDSAVDAFAGRRLLHQAARHLGCGGNLCLVANRHLDYSSVLRRSFQRVQLLAQNAKFRVYLASRR
ncbi:MAG: class I SAM-dependent methyltransferase [Halioglobus sp.]|nr:class I SAM-dependent methyltransferase [Halioglobus sp.]